jgi:PAS domain-containing protein
VRAYDWAGTSLGPISSWPKSLRTAVDIVLQSPIPLVMLWGPHGIMIYNDGYSVFAGGRHPRLLGSPVLEGWPEVADFNRRVMEVGLAGGTLSFTDQHLVLHRHGIPEDVWTTLDYSPIHDESGKPAGVLAIAMETTQRKLTEKALREREAELARVQQIGKVGGVEVDLRSGFRNQRSPEYLVIHGLPPEAVNETHEDWVRRLHPEDRERINCGGSRSKPRSSATPMAALSVSSARISTSPSASVPKKDCSASMKRWRAKSPSARASATGSGTIRAS